MNGIGTVISVSGDEVIVKIELEDDIEVYELSAPLSVVQGELSEGVSIRCTIDDDDGSITQITLHAD